MTIPTLLLALLISILFGALYHFIRDGGSWRLFLYFGTSILGFAAGQFVGVWRGWTIFEFGDLDIGMGLLGSLLFLMLSEWLSRIETKQESSV